MEYNPRRHSLKSSVILTKTSSMPTGASEGVAMSAFVVDCQGSTFVLAASGSLGCYWLLDIGGTEVIGWLWVA